MRPAIGLTAGGGGGKTRICAKTSRGPTTVASPAPPTIATPALSSARRVALPIWPSWGQPTWTPPSTRGLPQLSVNFHLGIRDQLTVILRCFQQSVPRCRSGREEQREPKCKCWWHEQRNGAGLPCLVAAVRSAAKLVPLQGRL